MIRAVKPIYGYGWTDGFKHIPEPAPFKIKAEELADGTITGHIVSVSDPDLNEAVIEASPRHASRDFHYNCSIRYQDGRVITGYCLIS
ncbi:hypothetical protein [Asticcacaulis machinosus]|uniref:Uncharacterized protein n=1 Tax=Asticcacaulis machinosus TaxID=2984211 RepID=A0ABT5HF99_9CAUL|nr:hypothetical protein [Asticcacaulis machinosus]MDC7674927.1 hypothetical protein [Asticcacaulis machinosus]